MTANSTHLSYNNRAYFTPINSTLKLDAEHHYHETPQHMTSGVVC